MKSWFDYESCDFSDDGEDEAGGPLAMRTLDIGTCRAVAVMVGCGDDGTRGNWPYI